MLNENGAVDAKEDKG